MNFQLSPFLSSLFSKKSIDFYAFYLLIILFIYLCLLHFISQYCLTYYPNTGDEHSVLFQAKIFSNFNLTANSPGFPNSFFSEYLEISGEKWFSQYPPVYSLMIAIGQFFNAPLVAVGVYSFFIFLFLFLLLVKIYHEITLEILLFCVFWLISPTFIFHSISYYTHIGSLFLYSLILFLFFMYISEENVKLIAIISICFGLAIGIRPFTFFLLSIPIILKIIHLYHNKVFFFSKEKIINLILPFFIILLLLLAYNFNQTSDLGKISYLNAGSNFQKLSLSNFTFQSLTRIFQMVNDTNKWIFASGYFQAKHLKWTIDGDINLGNLYFIIAIIFLVYKTFFKRSTNESLNYFREISLASIILLIFGHIFYNFEGGRFGERFFFEITWMILFHFICAITEILKIIKNVRLRLLLLSLFIIFLSIPSIIYYTPETMQYFRENNLRRMDLFIKTEDGFFKNAVVHILSTPDFYPPFYTRNNPDLTGTIYVNFDNFNIQGFKEKFSNKDHYLYYFDQNTNKSTLINLEEGLKVFQIIK